MRSALLALIVLCSFAITAHAEEPSAEKVDLKGGVTLFLHPDGTSRMIDAHGKPMSMSDGVEMETAEGETIMMLNKKIWVKYGPTGKGGRSLRND